MAETNQKLHGTFELDCVGCKNPVAFSIVDLDSSQKLVTCSSCGKKYGFQEETLKRQLKKFALLCKQIQESEEILSNAAIGVQVGQKEVQIPYKLLLLRLKSTLDLKVQDQKFVISFRVEPTALSK